MIIYWYLWSFQKSQSRETWTHPTPQFFPIYCVLSHGNYSTVKGTFIRLHSILHTNKHFLFLSNIKSPEPETFLIRCLLLLSNCTLYFSFKISFHFTELITTFPHICLFLWAKQTTLSLFPLYSFRFSKTICIYLLFIFICSLAKACNIISSGWSKGELNWALFSVISSTHLHFHGKD